MRPISILDGADAAIDRWLGVEKKNRPGQYRLRKVARRLRGHPRVRRDAAGLISVLLCILGKNFEEARYDGAPVPCDQNWRLRRRCRPPSTGVRQPEAALERRIVTLHTDTWANQVPTASGLCGTRSDRRRCIDLVHYNDRTADFTFYELKWRSDSPLLAAMEILQYGVLYLFCRYLLLESAYPGVGGDLLRAKVIGLRTLAPAGFYRGADLLWLEDSMREGLDRFLCEESRLDLRIDFAFEAFPGGVRWTPDLRRMRKTELTKALEGRHAIYSKRP